MTHKSATVVLSDIRDPRDLDEVNHAVTSLIGDRISRYVGACHVEIGGVYAGRYPVRPGESAVGPVSQTPYLFGPMPCGSSVASLGQIDFEEVRRIRDGCFESMQSQLRLVLSNPDYDNADVVQAFARRTGLFRRQEEHVPILQGQSTVISLDRSGRRWVTAADYTHRLKRCRYLLSPMWTHMLIKKDLVLSAGDRDPLLDYGEQFDRKVFQQSKPDDILVLLDVAY